MNAQTLQTALLILDALQSNAHQHVGCECGGHKAPSPPPCGCQQAKPPSHESKGLHIDAKSALLGGMGGYLLAHITQKPPLSGHMADVEIPEGEHTPEKRRERALHTLNHPRVAQALLILVESYLYNNDQKASEELRALETRLLSGELPPLAVIHDSLDAIYDAGMGSISAQEIHESPITPLFLDLLQQGLFKARSKDTADRISQAWPALLAADNKTAALFELLSSLRDEEHQEPPIEEPIH